MSRPASRCQFGLQRNCVAAAAIGGATLAAWLGISVAAQADNRQSEAVALARKTLAAKLALPPEQITTGTVAAVQWRDSALGCPERGVVPRPVITSGFKVTLRATEREYDVHVAGSRAVICGSQADNRISSAPLIDASLNAADAVRAVVAARLGIDPMRVNISSTRPYRSDTGACAAAPPKPAGAPFVVEGEAQAKPFRYYADDTVTLDCGTP
jgi:hypothetical protein